VQQISTQNTASYIHMERMREVFITIQFQEVAKYLLPTHRKNGMKIIYNNYLTLLVGLKTS
jgi:hypothetical protein